MIYKEKTEKFISKTGIQAFDTKTPIEELPIEFKTTATGLSPDNKSGLSLNAFVLWCKFLYWDWFKPYGQFSEQQILKMIDICTNDQQILLLMKLLATKEN